MKFRRIQETSIFKKLLLRTLPVLAVVSASIFLGLVYFSERMEKAYARRYYAGTALSRLYQTRQLELNFMLEDLDEEYFYERESYNLVQHGIAISLMKHDLKKVEEASAAQDKELVRRALATIEKYDGYFTDLVKEFKDRGYPPWGVEGAWRLASERLSREVERLSRPQLLPLLHTLAKHKEEYLVNRDHMRERYVNGLQTSIKQLQAQLLNAPRESRVHEAIDQYEATSLRHLSIQKRIGFGSETGIRHSLEEEAQLLQEMIEILRNKTSLDASNLRSIFFWSVVIILIVGLLTEALLFYFIALSISRPIERLTVAADQVRHEEDYVQLPVTSSDEVGVLTRVFNEMVAKLLSMRKLAEDRAEQAQKANEELKATQQQLLQSQKLEAVGTLAGGVAHDFNNILGAVLGYASHLKGRLQHDPEALSQLDIIRKSAERAADLTAKLLGFARKGQYQKTILNLNRVVEDALAMLERVLPKTIEIKTRLAPDLWAIEGDSTQFVQVLMNLAINSRDSMPNGGSLSFQSENVGVDEALSHQLDGVPPGRYVRISVSDTGEGIPKEIQSKIFDPFFTTKAVGKGSGLGLAMVYGITKSHDGALRLYSEVGHGTRFDIFIPALSVRSEAAQASGAGIEKVSPDFLSGKALLVVDDDEVLGNLIVHVIEEMGALVAYARSGEEAIRYCRDNGSLLEAVILDIMMPGLDGFKTASEIRNAIPGLPILFSSGYSEDGHTDEILKLSNTAFLQKPFSENDLVRVLSKLLNQKAQS